MIGIYTKQFGRRIFIALSTKGELMFSKIGFENHKLDLQPIFQKHATHISLNKLGEYEEKTLATLLPEETCPKLSQIYVKRLCDEEADLVSIGLVHGTPLAADNSAEKDIVASRYELVLKGMNDGIWDWTLLSDEVYYSPRWKSILGFEDHELENRLETWYQRMHPEDAARTEQIVKDYLAGKTDHLYHVTRFLHKDGSSRLIVCRGYLQRDENQVPVRIVGSHTDITELFEMEQELQQQKELFELAVTASNDGIWDWNMSTNELYLSPRWKQMFGYEDHEIINSVQGWKEIICEEDYKEAIRYVSKFKNGEIDEFKLKQRFKHKDGHFVYVLSNALKVKNNAGEVIRLVGSHTDITEYISIQNQLASSEEKYRKIIENMNLGILVVDNNDVIVDVFDKFLDLTGYDRNDLLGNKAQDVLLLPNDTTCNVEALIGSRLRKESSLYEIQIKCKNGNAKWVMVSGTPEINKYGEVVGSIGIHLDITERKEMELALIEAKMLAEESSAARETLLARVSHEMRTPMQAFLGFVNYVDTLEIPNDVKGYIKEIKLAIHSLNSLVNDLLDLNSIQNGRLKFVLQPLHIKPAFENLVNYYKRLIPANKNIKMGYSIDTYVPDVLQADAFRLQQIFGNLINNAIKYTNNGFINCSLKWKDRGSGKGFLIFKITDSGIGIPKKDFDNIFNEFVQLGYPNNANPHNGVGLGLSIVKQLVESQKGEIHVQSTVNVGTTFTVTIPTDCIAENEVEAPLEAEHGFAEDLPTIRVLIVEDNSIIRRVIASYLIAKNMHVDVAFNGLEALNLVYRYHYDLVFLDINMPIMNGYEAAQAIRQHYALKPQVHKTKVVALSASVIDLNQTDQQHYGFDDFIQKPIELPALYKYIKQSYLENQKPNCFAEMEGIADEVLKATDNIDLFFDDPELSLDIKLNVAKLIVTDLADVASELTELVQENNLSKIQHQLHCFKSSTGIMRLNEMSKTIEALEEIAKEANVLQPSEVATFHGFIHRMYQTRESIILKLKTYEC